MLSLSLKSRSFVADTEATLSGLGSCRNSVPRRRLAWKVFIVFVNSPLCTWTSTSPDTPETFVLLFRRTTFALHRVLSSGHQKEPRCSLTRGESKPIQSLMAQSAWRWREESNTLSWCSIHVCLFSCPIFCFFKDRGARHPTPPLFVPTPNILLKQNVQDIASPAEHIWEQLIKLQVTSQWKASPRLRWRTRIFPRWLEPRDAYLKWLMGIENKQQTTAVPSHFSVMFESLRLSSVTEQPALQNTMRERESRRRLIWTWMFPFVMIWGKAKPFCVSSLLRLSRGINWICRPIKVQRQPKKINYNHFHHPLLIRLISAWQSVL